MQTYSEVTDTNHFATIYGSQTYTFGLQTYIYVSPTTICDVQNTRNIRNYVPFSISWGQGVLFQVRLSSRRLLIDWERLINLSISTFPTRTAYIRDSLRRRRETIRHFSINWVVWASVLSHPSSRIVSSDWAELTPPVCKLTKTYLSMILYSKQVDLDAWGS